MRDKDPFELYVTLLLGFAFLVGAVGVCLAVAQGEPNDRPPSQAECVAKGGEILYIGRTLCVKPGTVL